VKLNPVYPAGGYRKIAGKTVANTEILLRRDSPVKNYLHHCIAYRQWFKRIVTVTQQNLRKLKTTRGSKLIRDFLFNSTTRSNPRSCWTIGETIRDIHRAAGAEAVAEGGIVALRHLLGPPCVHGRTDGEAARIAKLAARQTACQLLLQGELLCSPEKQNPRSGLFIGAPGI